MFKFGKMFEKKTEVPKAHEPYTVAEHEVNPAPDRAMHKLIDRFKERMKYFGNGLSGRDRSQPKFYMGMADKLPALYFLAEITGQDAKAIIWNPRTHNDAKPALTRIKKICEDITASVEIDKLRYELGESNKRRAIEKARRKVAGEPPEMVKITTIDTDYKRGYRGSRPKTEKEVPLEELDSVPEVMIPKGLLGELNGWLDELREEIDKLDEVKNKKKESII